MARSLRTFICLLLTAGLLAGCGGSGVSSGSETEAGGSTMDALLAEIAQLGSSPDDNYRMWYEIFVYSYCDSDGDGIGDLNGVRSKLDELQALGVTGIWLMPIHPSTTYHKYNVSDYYAIDPDYGTMEDFEALIADCDARGIRVILDLVVNHTGSDHAWFRELKKYLKSVPGDMQKLDADACKYVDYYNLNTTGGSGYSKIPNTEFYYECRFSADMPDLNLGSEAVREEIKAIMEFWIGKGVAGFRVDAAKEFYSGDHAKNAEVLSWLQSTAESIKSDVYMVAEVWDTFSVITQYYTSGICSIFDYPFGNNNGKIVNTLRGAGDASTVSAYATGLEAANDAYSDANADYIDAPFLSNHDVGRIAGFVGRDELKIKLAGAMNIFMSGSCFIYYGEEIGMVSGGRDDPSKRAPMYWNAERNDGTTGAPPGCTLPDEYPFGSLAEQKTDDGSIYNYYRQAGAIRNALPVISHGDTTAETALNVNCISAQRKTWGDESCIILMNINTEAAQVDLSAYGDWTLAASLSADGGAVTLSGTELSLPAFGTAILIPNT
ncbi:MAG: alpha-amylase [Oscillospiraceae bacterium]|nr:alpha-amylase [Oscillospiraceae bacterium]